MKNRDGLIESRRRYRNNMYREDRRYARKTLIFVAIAIAITIACILSSFSLVIK